MKISIVTITFNNKCGLLRTIESVNKQTYKYIQHVIVDGSSSDGTDKILNSYRNSSKHDVISEEDRGIYDAMNKGIRMSSGKYIIFMNAGDVFANDNVINNFSQFFKQNFGIIYGDSLENANNLYYKKSKDISNISHGMFAHHQSIFYRSDLCAREYNLSYKIGADYEFTASIAINDIQSMYLAEPVCIFEHGGISQKKIFKGIIDSYKIKRTVLNQNSLKAFLICCKLMLANMLRIFTPKLYAYLRYGN